MELKKMSSSILPEGLGDELQESGPSGRKGGAPNWGGGGCGQGINSYQ
jgi:hypothetical protein